MSKGKGIAVLAAVAMALGIELGAWLGGIELHNPTRILAGAAIGLATWGAYELFRSNDEQ
jgi:predicted MFS family arabinose efflux permease